MSVVASNYAREENDFSASQAREIFQYISYSGALIWRERPVEKFRNIRVALSWNAKHAGREAGSVGRCGYRRVRVGPKSYFAHRIVWLIINGMWPDGQIDHIDQNRLNNRLSNLRVVTSSQNARNRTLPSSNTSGVIGVRQCPKSGRWRAEITVHGRKRFLGTFSDKSEAVAARQSAQTQLGFSLNHGRDPKDSYGVHDDITQDAS